MAGSTFENKVKWPRYIKLYIFSVSCIEMQKIRIIFTERAGASSVADAGDLGSAGLEAELAVLPRGFRLALSGASLALGEG